jgi:hypothetical protein
LGVLKQVYDKGDTPPFAAGGAIMIWAILLVVVLFLVATAMPLIRENQYEKQQPEEDTSDEKSYLDEESKQAQEKTHPKGPFG